MRKLFAVVFLMIFMVGCSSQSRVTPVTENIEFDTRICYYNECYEAHAVIIANGEMVFDITSPEDIRGLRLMFSGDKVTATFEGLEYTEENPQLFGAFSVANEVFADIRQNEPKVKLDDGSYSVESNVGGSEYELTISGAGIPIELEVKRGDLEMSFLNIRLIE